MNIKEKMTPYLDLTILVCLHFDRIGSLVKSLVQPLKLKLLFRVGVRSLLASSESLDNVHEPENKRGVKHEVNVKPSRFYLLTYWILLLARPVFFFFFSPASTLGVWPLT